MLPKQTNYKVIRHTLTYYILKVTSTYDYSYSYNILSHLSVSRDRRYASLLTMAVTLLLGEVVILLIKLQANLRSTTLIWSVAFIANGELELVYRRTLITRLYVSLSIHWVTSINWETMLLE